MFKFDEICELVRLVASSGVAAVEIEHAGSRLKVDGVAPAPQAPVAVPAAPGALAAGLPPASAAASPAPSREGVAPSEDAASDDAAHYVTSPIVGTFYRAPNPDAEPYVKVGDRVRQGQVLCIVEAMKLMNEIESDVDGTVVKVLPENSEPVEYGERLFAIEPD